MPKIQGPVTFASKYNTYMLTMERTWVEVQAGIPIVHEGKMIRFEGGTYTTSDPKEIEFLRKHPHCGIDFHEVKDAGVAQALQEAATGAGT